MKLPAAFAPFRHGAFSRYIAGEAISMTGTWMQTFAQGWVLTGLTSNALVLALVNLAQGIPTILLTFVGGSSADKYDKRLIIHAALAIQLIIAAAMGWLILGGHVEVWHLAVAAVILGVVYAFEVPAVAAFVPELVRKEEMSQAIAIDRSVFHATRLLGPATAGLLVQKVGLASAYFLNAASYLALIAAILTIKARPRSSAEDQAKREGGIGPGLAFVRNDAPTRGMILLLCSVTSFASPVLMILLPLYARNTLHFDSGHAGVLTSLSGVGALTGSLGLLLIRPTFRATALRLASVTIVLALLGLSQATTLLFACISIVGLTLGLSTTFGVANIVIQERAPDHLRGRISGVASLSFFGILPFAGLLSGGLVQLVGMRPALMIAAACLALAAGAVLLHRHGAVSTAPAAQSDE